MASVDRYDPSLDAWVTPTVNTTSQSQPTTIASLATKKSAFSAIATEGVIYAMGGYDGEDEPQGRHAILISFIFRHFKR